MVGDGTITTYQIVAKNVSVKIGSLKAKTYILVVDGVFVGLLIGIPEIINLNAHINLGGQHIDFIIGRKSVWAGLKPYGTIGQTQSDESEDKSFSTYCNTTASLELLKEGRKEDMVVVMALEVSFKRNLNDIINDLELMKRQQTVTENYSQLGISERAKLEELLYSEAFLVWSFLYSRSVEVSVQQFSESKNDSTIYHRPRRLLPKDNQVAESKVNNMPKAEVIAAATSAPSFPIVVATEKDRRSKCCVDYRFLKQITKADCLSLRSVEERLDSLVWCKVFINPDLFPTIDKSR